MKSMNRLATALKVARERLAARPAMGPPATTPDTPKTATPYGVTPPRKAPPFGGAAGRRR